MTEACGALVLDFTRAHPDITVVTNFGPSVGLARQIEQGSPADIYLSANPAWMDHLQQKGLIVAQSRTTLAGNRLILIGRERQPINSLADLVSFDRIAIGNPQNVPAGHYARQSLARAGVYEKLLDSGRLVFAKDVRQALLYAERGEVDGAIVYRSDQKLAKKTADILEGRKQLKPRLKNTWGFYGMKWKAKYAKNLPYEHKYWQEKGWLRLSYKQALKRELAEKSA